MAKLGVGSVALVVMSLLGCGGSAQKPPDIFELGRLLGSGVNFGNALEAPSEGEWGMVLEEGFFELVRQGGFKTIRLPTSWTNHAARTAPYRVDPKWFERVDWAIQQASKRGLRIILNIHHYDELNANPQAEEARYLGIWKQIAERYKNQPSTVYFELLNEPHDQFNNNPELWNSLFLKALAVVRQSNPSRAVIVGPVFWNNIESLPSLKLPASDRNLIVTVHFYDPFEFTHQGAEWVDPSPPLGKVWTGSAAEQKAIRDSLDMAQAWAAKENRPLLVGEFGAYEKADLDSRVRWTSFVRSEFARRGFAWAYWEFGAGFGIYDRQAKQWRLPLLKALIP